MSRNLFYLVLVIFVGSSLACQRTVTNTSNRTAPEVIEKSISIQANKKLILQKASLGKIFLLTAAVKESTSFPVWQDLRPQLVMFEKVDGVLGLYELPSVSGATVFENKGLLMSLAIDQENDREITFKWSNEVPIRISSNMESPDETEEIRNAQNGDYQGLQLITALTISSELKNNSLKIKQSARIRFQKIRGKTELEKKYSSPDDEDVPVLEVMEKSVEILYSISPYQENKTFEPVEPDFLNRVGFFLASSGKPEFSEEVKVNINKWDISTERGPIVFALSKHFPVDLLAPTKEGILYWNKVLGKNVIQVTEGADPESDFPNRTVLVHWVPWKDAGAAWASLQSDPLTGEVLRGQIYITSVFAQPKTSWQLNDRPVFALGAMKSATVCHRKQTGAELLALDTQKLLVSDIIRHVVAHEAGHVMGLRHNFAGSVAVNNIDIKTLKAAKHELLAKPESAPGLELSTSIMDYIGGIEELLLARTLLVKPLTYDKLALDYAYRKDREALFVGKNRAYCTDEDIFVASEENLKLLGCERFDTPVNPLHVATDEFFRTRDRYVQSEFELILQYVYPAGTSKLVDIDVALARYFEDLGENAYGNSLKSKVSKFLSLMSTVTKEGETKSSSQFYLDWNKKWWEPETEAKTLTVLESWMKEVDGPVELLRTLVPLKGDGQYDSLYFSTQLHRLKAKEMFKTGVTRSGRAYVLAENQQKRILVALEQNIAHAKSATEAVLAKSLLLNKEQEKTDSGGKAQASKALQKNIGQNTWLKKTQDMILNLLLSSQDVLESTIAEGKITLPMPSLDEDIRHAVGRLALAKNWSADDTVAPAAAVVKKIEEGRLDLIYARFAEIPKVNEPRKISEHLELLRKLLDDHKISQQVYDWAKTEVSLLESMTKE